MSTATTKGMSKCGKRSQLNRTILSRSSGCARVRTTDGVTRASTACACDCVSVCDEDPPSLFHWNLLCVKKAGPHILSRPFGRG